MIKVSIIVPVYNEEKTVCEILERVNAQEVSGVDFEVITVDDGSTDRTVELLEARPELYDSLVKLPTNGGKGAAVIAGLGVASGEYVLFQDADLEYDPAEYGRLFSPAREFSADIVMGSRFLAPAFTRVHYFWNKVGNRLITLLFNLMFNTTFTDIYSCYLMFRRDLVDSARLRTRGWEQQAEILAAAVKAGAVFYEVPISYRGRTFTEGKKIRAWHVIPVIWTIISRRFI